ncbi:MAG: heme exporter protein CcmB [Alphaproteobacteria bacterium]|nr:heme exporter protein CcmB [Alphaproteobacteria bacterium]
MRTLAALFTRDFRLATRTGGNTLTVVLFFALVAILLPFAIGPDVALLQRLGPAIIWLSALLALLLSLDRLFLDDHRDGSLAAMRAGPVALEWVVLVRIFGHWLTTAVPIVLVSIPLAPLFNFDFELLFALLVALMAGTPALAANAAIGAAITVSLPRGGLIAPIVILPLAIPVLIFGVAAADPGAGAARGSALLFLAGYSMLVLVVAPIAAALALRSGAE